MFLLKKYTNQIILVLAILVLILLLIIITDIHVANINTELSKVKKQL